MLSTSKVANECNHIIIAGWNARQATRGLPISQIIRDTSPLRTLNYYKSKYYYDFFILALLHSNGLSDGGSSVVQGLRGGPGIGLAVSQYNCIQHLTRANRIMLSQELCTQEFFYALRNFFMHLKIFLCTMLCTQEFFMHFEFFLYTLEFFYTLRNFYGLCYALRNFFMQIEIFYTLRNFFMHLGIFLSLYYALKNFFMHLRNFFMHLGIFLSLCYALKNFYMHLGIFICIQEFLYALMKSVITNMASLESEDNSPVHRTSFWGCRAPNFILRYWDCKNLKGSVCTS